MQIILVLEHSRASGLGHCGHCCYSGPGQYGPWEAEALLLLCSGWGSYHSAWGRLGDGEESTSLLGPSWGYSSLQLCHCHYILQWRQGTASTDTFICCDFAKWKALSLVSLSFHIQCMSPNFPAKPHPCQRQRCQSALVFLCPASLPAGNQSQDKQAAPLNLSADHLPRTDDLEFSQPAEEVQTQPLEVPAGLVSYRGSPP